jgi:hypothetical protein
MPRRGSRLGRPRREAAAARSGFWGPPGPRAETSGTQRGFATYAEWLWEYEGRGAPQEIVRASYDAIPASDPFWAVVIGHPGVHHLFDFAVYLRGANLQALRNEVGGVLGDHPHVGSAQQRRSRHDARVHRPRRADLRRAARRVFTTWLFTATKLAAPPFTSQRPAAAAS